MAQGHKLAIANATDCRFNFLEGIEPIAGNEEKRGVECHQTTPNAAEISENGRGDGVS